MIHWLKKAASSIANASPGKVRLFVDSSDNFFKTKDESGVLRVLGDGIVSITLVATNGLDKTYRITRQSGATFDYVVRDGQNGVDGQGQPANANPSKIDPDDAASIGTATTRYALQDHQHQIDTDVPVALGATAAEGTSSSFARADHVHVNPVIAHEAAADPHPQYTTTSEAAAAAPVQSVNGQTGAVNIPTANPAVTNTARSGAITTTVTTAASYPVAANSAAAGHVYRFSALLLVTNTTAASNLVSTVAVGATAVATLTQALGTTARTAQPALVEGLIHFQSATAADGFVRAFASTAVAFDAMAGTGATSVTVTTNANTDVNIKLNTSAATSTVIVQSVSIERIK